jgi:hypothetical protein
VSVVDSLVRKISRLLFLGALLVDVLVNFTRKVGASTTAGEGHTRRAEYTLGLP